MTTTPETLVGTLIEAIAPRRRKLRGVVLPPAPGSRSKALRLAVDGAPPRRFDPDGWQITVIAGPDYNHSTLPAEHLATMTMLKTEQRKTPAAGDAVPATYAVRDGAVPLYAVADAKEMPPLVGKRAEAWTAGRTCVRCEQLQPRPLLASPEGDRYCSPCRDAAAAERWAAQSRIAQAESAAWAAAILADPDVLLVAADSWNWSVKKLRAETVAGDVVADAAVRSHSEIFSPRREYTDEERAKLEQEYAGTVTLEEFEPLAEKIGAARMVTWWTPPSGMPVLDDYRWHGRPELRRSGAEEDVLSERCALWCGQILGTHHYGHRYWHPAPELPWRYSCGDPVYVRVNRSVQPRPRPANGIDLGAAISDMRTLLRVMAYSWLPEPRVIYPQAEQR